MMLEATEILTTARCPNNCAYCYISKDPVMKDVHQEIIDDLKSGTYISRLKKVYGDKLSTLGLWGTEPTLTLDVIATMLPKLSDTFPRLKEISFSTSMIDYEPIVRFAQATASVGLELKVQVSLDGPAFITDVNRFKGAAEIIPNNLFGLVSLLQDSEAKVEFHWKATLTADNIKEMVGEPAKVDEYFHFFEELNTRFDAVNHNKNIQLLKGSFKPTLAAPGKYTSNIGRNFARFLKLVRQKGYKTTYTTRMAKLIEFENELGTNKKMFTCSGGDSNGGIGRNYHICHRSFYVEDDRCVDAILKQGEESWDYTHYQRGTLDILRKYFIVDIDDNAGLTRVFYIMRNYHDFWRFQIGYIRAMVRELALVGQASQEYLKSDSLGTLFALFVSTCLSCPAENILNTGSLHLAPLSLLRMFGNGAFQEILNGVSNRK